MKPLTEVSVALRAAVLTAILVVCGYAGVQLVGRFSDRPGRIQIAVPPTLPPGADDPLNRGILVMGGTMEKRRDIEREDTVQVGPYSTADEFGGRGTVAGFWMQEHEVTNEEFRRFDSGHQFPSGQEQHPVANITWRQAMNYATSIGGILPTETQWQFAAAGPARRKYPWGEAEPTCVWAQFRDCEPSGTIEVMTRPDGATPEGIHDLAGNVSEWVMPDWFVPGKTPVNDASRRMRGGSFVDDAFFLRASNRNNDFFEGFKYVTTGFRVVWPLAGDSN